MTAKRFFILIDDEYEDTLPAIRDRTFKIKDIYGHYRYDNLEEICNELNRLNDENEQLQKQLETANEDKKYVKQVIKDRIKHFHSYPCIDSSPQDHKGCWGLKMELEKFYDDVEPYL